MAATFSSLKNSYADYNKLDTAALYESLGWADLADKPDWANTCAVRMHLALLDAGEAIPGRFTVLAGKHKGSQIEPSQMRLAKRIEHSGRFGTALKLDKARLYGEGYKKMKGQAGIVSFQHMSGYAGGHIDVLDTRAWTCLRACYMRAGEFWFWALA